MLRGRWKSRSTQLTHGWKSWQHDELLHAIFAKKNAQLVQLFFFCNSSFSFFFKLTILGFFGTQQFAIVKALTVALASGLTNSSASPFARTRNS